MKVLIGLPRIGDVPSEFLRHYDAMQRPAGCVPIVVERQMIDRARNLIVEEALRQPNVSHVLMLDDDTIVAPDTLMRLLAYDVPLVSALYCSRTPPHWPVAYRRHPDGRTYVPLSRFAPGLQVADAVGAGCLLVKREVFERVPAPWFKWTLGSSTEPACGEDLWFCERAREAGYPILLAGDVQVGHLTRHAVTYADFMAASEGKVSRNGDPAYDAIVALSQEIRPWQRPASKPAPAPRAPSRAERRTRSRQR